MFLMVIFEGRAVGFTLQDMCVHRVGAWGVGFMAHEVDITAL